MPSSFNYMFKDKDLIAKAVPILIIMFIINLCAVFFASSATPKFFMHIIAKVSYVVMFFTTFGYAFSCMQNIAKNKENPVLPYINPIANIDKGINFAIALLIVKLIVILCSLVFAIPMTIAISSKEIFMRALFVYCCFLGIFLLCFSNALAYIFIKTEKLLSFVCFKKAFHIIKQGFGKYIKSVLCTTMLAITMYLFATVMQHILGLPTLYKQNPTDIFVLKAVTYALIMSPVCAYIFYVNAHVTANCSDAEVE